MASEEIKAAVTGRVQGAFAGMIALDEASPPAVTARAFLGLLKRAGALSDGEPVGTPVVMTPPVGEKTGESEERSEEGDEVGLYKLDPVGPIA
jgi:hypothetical protein